MASQFLIFNNGGSLIIENLDITTTDAPVSRLFVFYVKFESMAHTHTSPNTLYLQVFISTQGAGATASITGVSIRDIVSSDSDFVGIEARNGAFTEVLGAEIVRNTGIQVRASCSLVVLG